MGGDHTIKAIAVNAWQWAEESKVARLQLHELSYRGYKRGALKSKDVEERLAAAVAQHHDKEVKLAARSVSMPSRAAHLLLR